MPEPAQRIDRAGVGGAAVMEHPPDIAEQNVVGGEQRPCARDDREVAFVERLAAGRFRVH